MSAYIDLKNSPRFPFGYGLSYTAFQYSGLKLSKEKMKRSETIEVSMDLANTGHAAGEEVVQLYLRDKVGSVVRPVMELKDFQKVKLAAGETKTLKFVIDGGKLSFYNQDLEYGPEPGEFNLMLGSSSGDIRLSHDFELVD